MTNPIRELTDLIRGVSGENSIRIRNLYKFMNNLNGAMAINIYCRLRETYNTEYENYFDSSYQIYMYMSRLNMLQVSSVEDIENIFDGTTEDELEDDITELVGVLSDIMWAFITERVNMVKCEFAKNDLNYYGGIHTIVTEAIEDFVSLTNNSPK